MINQLKYIYEINPIFKIILRSFYDKINDFNYKYELIQLDKKFECITFNSFEIISFSIADELLHLILKNSKNGETLFDIGAFYGAYTLSFAAKYRNNTVISFEPNPESFIKLCKNIDCNNFSDRVKAYNFGLSNHEDTLPFYVSSQGGRSSFNKFNAESDNNYIKEIKIISVKKIDSMIEELPKPDHIKIDVEGLGLEILQGMKNIISKYQPIIYFEPHEVSSNKSDLKYRENQLNIFFHEMGYSIKKLGYAWICTSSNLSKK